MIILDPFNFPKAWGDFIVSGYTFPGVLVSVDGVERAYDWVIQKGTAKSGASSVYRGQLLTENMKTEFEFPSVAAFVELQKAIPIVTPLPGQKPPSLNVTNQIFQFVNVNRLVIKKYGIAPSAGLSWRVTATWDEYSPPAPTKTGAADPAKADPTKTGAQSQIEKLQAEAAALAGKLTGAKP